METKQARTVCDPNCHANPKCGLTATIRDGKIIAVDPADYPVSGYENRICLMGRARLEYQYHPDRLHTPLKRVGPRGGGEWEPVSWDEAVTLFVDNQKRISEKYGPKSVVFTPVTGALAMLTRGSVSRYAALTGASMTTASSGFDVGVPKGLEYMFGIPAENYFMKGGHSYDDAVNSEVILIWGVNPAVTRSVDHAPLKAAGKAGVKLICIDPTRTETAGWCDEWISLRPGSDGALALALANWMIQQDRIDRAFLSSHTDMPFLVKTECGSLLREKDIVPGGGDSAMIWGGETGAAFPAGEGKPAQLDVSHTVSGVDGTEIHVRSVFTLYAEMAAEFTPEHAEQITGVEAKNITNLAQSYANAKPAAIRVGYGIDRYYYADSTARAIAVLACLTGNIGESGGGVSLHEGVCTVPVRGRNFYAPEGKYPNVVTFQEVDAAVRHSAPYPIKMECVSLGNPYILAKPNSRESLKGYIDNLEFITVIDHFMTDTAKWADLVLPACTIFERTDIVVDRMVQLQQRVVEPEGEAKSDFEIFTLFAKQMGLGDYFNKSTEEYIEETFASDNPLMKDVTLERLKEEKAIYPWSSREPYIGFKDRKFRTVSGRIECYKEDLRAYGSELPVYREPIEASPKNPLFKKYPLVFLSSHSRYRIHSTFANLDETQTREPDPLVLLSPQDAHPRGIQDGSVIRVFNDRGFVKIKCKFDVKIRPGTLLIEEGRWVEHFIEGDPYSLLHDQTNPTTDNYFQFDVLVEAEGT